jgi:hypothetical protein
MSDNLAGNDINAPDETDDRAYLGALQGRGFTVGFIDEVNGPASDECPGFHPSRHELEVLAKYWFDRRLSVVTRCWLHDQYGSDYIRIPHYADRRLDRIENILGEEQFSALVQEVKEKHRRALGDEAWEAFKRGDTEWRDQELARIYAGIEREQDENNALSCGPQANMDCEPPPF